MAKSRRKESQGGSEREGAGVCEVTRDESKASRPETKNERRRREKEELLRQDERHEIETHIFQNSQRPRLPD